MASASIQFFGSFKVNFWYKLAIYLGSALLVLAFVFDKNANAANYTSFGIWSLVLGSAVWIIDDTIFALGNIKHSELSYAGDQIKNVKMTFLVEDMTNEELERIRNKKVTRWITFDNPDGTRDKCSKCHKTDLFEVLTLTSDGWLLFRCSECKAEFKGNASQLTGVRFNPDADLV
jgi:hypothetical protein